MEADAPSRLEGVNDQVGGLIIRKKSGLHHHHESDNR